MKKLFFEVAFGYTKPVLVQVETSEINAWKKLYKVELFDNKTDADKYLLEINKPVVHHLTRDEQIEQYIWGCKMENIKPDVKAFINALDGNQEFEEDKERRQREIEQYLFACEMENITPEIGKYLRKRYA